VQRLLRSPAGPLAARLITKRTFARTMTRIFGPDTPPEPSALDAFWELATRDGGRAAMASLIHYIDERRRHRARWVGALQRTRVPLKLIDGAADPVSGAHLAARYRELVPDADVTVLDRIGHYPHVEDAPAVGDAYEAFRRRCAGA
jgi:pimeloyl-ACP methyl ester carboxylesterase